MLSHMKDPNMRMEPARRTRALCPWNGAAVMEAESSGGEWLHQHDGTVMAGDVMVFHVVQ
jgi:hypothetical protein